MFFHKPSVKTMRDKLLPMMADLRGENKRNARISGTVEDIDFAEQLLDYFILEVDETDEKRSKKYDSRTAREESLVAAEEDIQRSAVTRRQTVGDSGTGSTRSTPCKRCIVDDEDGWNQAMSREL